MRAVYGELSDLSSWMKLVRSVAWNFPGLETEKSLLEHEATVRKFMGKRQAICVKENGEVIAEMLFSRGHNMICCLAVSPEHRRRGLASVLLTEALQNLDHAKPITVSTFCEGDEKVRHRVRCIKSLVLSRANSHKNSVIRIRCLC